MRNRCFEKGFQIRNENLHEETTLQTQNTTDEALLDLIIDSIEDVKGQNIVKLDLREIDEAPANYFVICEGESTTQISSIAQRIEKRLKDELGLRPSHIEGRMTSTWVLVDYFTIVVHVFYPETREFYDIEDLWSDAKVTEYQNI